MKSRKEVQRLVKKIFAASLKDGQLDGEIAKKVIAKLEQSRPRGYQAIADAYLRLIRLEVERNRAVVESFTPLDDESRQRISTDLKKKYGPQVTVEFVESPELMGGIRIRVGSDVWDGSVKNRLARLTEKFV